MQIQRVKRLARGDEADLCDSCDEPMELGYHITGEDVSGPRGSGLNICDACFAAARKSKIGFARDSKPL